ncbi:hypothetical protein [Hyphobacterium sp.]|uniref:hypothetical protein n=1 Tax=Hyphobacterium sp. TaxID=2004662 RepID=UPI00374A5229
MSEAETVIRNVMVKDEELLWSGQPDWANSPRPTKAKDRLKAFGMCAAAGTATVLLATWGLSSPIEGFLAILLGIGVVMSAIILLASFITMVNPGTPALDEEYYGLTDRRLICISRSNWRRTSIMRGFVAGVDCVAVGKRYDVYVVLAPDFEGDDDLVTYPVAILLRAIPDGPEVEKLLLETLMPVDADGLFFPNTPKEERLQ